MEQNENPAEDKLWLTPEEFKEYKLDAVARACVYYVLAGEITTSEVFRLRDRMMQLPINEVLAMLVKSKQLAEEHGLPLVYRHAGVMR